MNDQELEERTNPEYLKQVERDYREDGREETAEDYRACRLKIKLLEKKVKGLERKEIVLKKFIARVIKGFSIMIDKPCVVDHETKEVVFYTGIKVDS